MAESNGEHITRNKDLGPHLEEFVGRNKLRLRKTTGLKLLKLLSLYLLEASETGETRVSKVFSEISDQAREIIMTTAEKLRKEGRIETTVKNVQNMLKEGFDWQTIRKITGTSQQEFKRIQKRKK